MNLVEIQLIGANVQWIFEEIRLIGGNIQGILVGKKLIVPKDQLVFCSELVTVGSNQSIFTQEGAIISMGSAKKLEAMFGSTSGNPFFPAGLTPYQNFTKPILK